jgi:glycosyltransferase involved in cell wall biosynthesis
VPVEVLTELPAPAVSRTSERIKPAAYVCMIAYTDYVTDARVRLQAETLAAHGFHVSCLTPRNEGNPPCFTLQGVDVRELAVSKYRGKSMVAYVASYVRFLVVSSFACLGRLFRRELDVVHVHNLPDFLVLAGLLPRLAGRKVVLDVHDSVPETFEAKFSGSSWARWLLRFEERVSARVAHRVLCVNDPQRDVLVRRGIPEAKTMVTMNVPDPRIFSAAGPQVRARSGNRLDLVYHGTMAHRLGVDLLIRATARVCERVPHTTLHLWGRGDDLSSFQALAHELGMSAHVEFNPTGYPLEDLPERLRGMDIGLVGNRHSEASELMLPVKLLEYVALGIPVVAPRLPAIQRYFTDDMITYYEPENLDSLAAAILRLHGDADLRRRQAAKARTFLAHYGWERQGPELVDMYRTLVEN